MQTEQNIIHAVFGFLVFTLFYFAPTLNARNREHPHYPVIFLVNLLSGWTIIGWFVAIIWSCASIKPSRTTQARDSACMKYSQLERLASLKERGLVTDEEFEIEKNKLLST